MKEELCFWVWKEDNMRYLLSKDANHASPFASLKVTDARGIKVLSLCAKKQEERRRVVRYGKADEI